MHSTSTVQRRATNAVAGDIRKFQLVVMKKIVYLAILCCHYLSQYVIYVRHVIRASLHCYELHSHIHAKTPAHSPSLPMPIQPLSRTQRRAALQKSHNALLRYKTHYCISIPQDQQKRQHHGCYRTSRQNVGGFRKSRQNNQNALEIVHIEILKRTIAIVRDVFQWNYRLQKICIIRLISLKTFLQFQKPQQTVDDDVNGNSIRLSVVAVAVVVDCPHAAKHNPQALASLFSCIRIQHVFNSNRNNSNNNRIKHLATDNEIMRSGSSTARSSSFSSRDLDISSQIVVLARYMFSLYVAIQSTFNHNHNTKQHRSSKRSRQCQYYLPILQRTYVLLILLSTLWHRSECFHGSLKPSSNVVKTKYGLLRGIVLRSTPLVEAYLGIPYASPPVGSLRFMPPITPSTWKSIRSADRFSAACPQVVPLPPNGPEALLEVPRARLAQLRRLLPLLKNQSEDCLYLNIYVPYDSQRRRRSTSSEAGDSTSNNLATILFIHGESYSWNSGNPYDGSELASNGNVIVVTINFRLGIFGFLKTGGKESAQGNFGLMDLVAGLHWLKENLPAFGGDPQSITLIGHGTGAALANILVVSPVSSDLVQRVVLVSGSALSPWAIQRNPLFVKRRVAEQTGCHGDMLYDDLAPCLRTKSVSDLLAVKIDHPRFLVGFAPFVDGTVISPYANSIGALSLPAGSAIVSTSGIEFANFPKRDLIFCLTSVESYLDLNAQDLEFGFNETRRDRILRTFVRNNYHYHLNEIFAVLKNEYTDWEKAIRNPLSSRDATLAFLSDGHTASALIKLGYMHSLRGGRSFFLHFKHRTAEEEYPQRTGSVRGEDVPFWLGLPISPLFPHNYTSQEKRISHLMLQYLANFAKNGNPNQFTQLTSSPASPSTLPIVNLSSSRSHYSNAKDLVKRKRSSSTKFRNLTTSLEQNGQTPNGAAGDDATQLNLAVLYNQRRSNGMRDRRASSRRRMRNSEGNYLSGEPIVGKDGEGPADHFPFWDAYDVVNQLYLELGNTAEAQSHYRGHKLSMWLNLIPQLHKHSNNNDQSMRHHQFADDLNSRDLYEGVVRPQLQTKPIDDEDTLLIQIPTTTMATKLGNSEPGRLLAKNATAVTTECASEGMAYSADITTQPSTAGANRTLPLETAGQKDLATASTGIIGNLEVLRRLSGKPFQSYTTALVATVSVGCFLLILNILIFAGIYHQREKRARDTKTKEELQDNDHSNNSSIVKLETIVLDESSCDAYGNKSGMDGASGAGVGGAKAAIIFGEYSCYDEKTKQIKSEKLPSDMMPTSALVNMPPSATHMLDPSNWTSAANTLDLLNTKQHMPLAESSSAYALNELAANEVHNRNEIELVTYGRGGAVAAAANNQLPTQYMDASQQYNFAMQSGTGDVEKMSYKDIEAASTAAGGHEHDDIPEPPPPPRSYQQAQQQAVEKQQQQPTTSGGSGVGGGILRQSGSQTGGKKRVHIQEISV